MNYRIVLVSIIHKNNFQEFLLVKRKREPFIGRWSLAGGVGALEQEKDPFKAINLENQGDFNTDFKGKFYTARFKEGPEPTIALYFVGELVEEPKVEEDNITISDPTWFSKEDLLKIDLAFEEDQEVLKEFLAGCSS